MKANCRICDRKQIHKVCELLSLSKENETRLDEIALDYLETVDMQKTNPEVMGELWKLLTAFIKDDNPYREVKKYYNDAVTTIIPKVEKRIEESEQPLQMALRIAICGNLIDFAAKHTFDIHTLERQLSQVEETSLAIDDSRKLFETLQSANQLLYLGDNCGEIALDKLFLKEIQRMYPKLKIAYGVRGKPIVNDVTVEDANQVGMSEIAEVISNGDGALGTVLTHTSDSFQKMFERADVIISKGQGNYESLVGNKKQQLYFLFMAKCENVTKPLKIPEMSIVCLQNRVDLIW